MRIADHLSETLGAQRGQFFLWSPVCFGAGIGAYFALSTEPSMQIVVIIALMAVVMAVLARSAGESERALGIAIALFAAGFSAGAWRANAVAAPVIAYPYYGQVTGTISDMDRSSSGALRLLLSDVALTDRDNPRFVRMSLHLDEIPKLTVGMRIQAVGSLTPPQGPVEPNGFDFRRHVWFLQLGGLGYTRDPITILSPPQGWSLGAMRFDLTDVIRTHIAGDAGAFAAAIVSGDRSGLSEDLTQNLRAANLSHLLSISGLHMGLLSGFVFAMVRLGLVMVPLIALRWPIKKIASITAIAAGAGYLAISGGAIPTERAFVMATVAFGAVLLDRRVFSLRAVAVAAWIVLLRRPESILSPGFQMSFAATVALIAGFEALNGRWFQSLPKVPRQFLSVVLTSLIAGTATAPFAAAHFNMVSHYGLIANVVAVPLMGTIVMPAAVVAVVLLPVGLAEPAFWIMGQGLTAIIWIADATASWPNSVGYVPTPPHIAMVAMSIGGLFLVLWSGWGRFMGVFGLCASLLIWSGSERPEMLISERGRLIGLMVEGRRALSTDRAERFTAQTWLENDGVRDPAPWPDPAIVGGYEIVQVMGKRAAQEFAGCTVGQIVVSNQRLPWKQGCLVIDASRLRRSGSLSLNVQDGQIVITAANENARLWTSATDRAPWYDLDLPVINKCGSAPPNGPEC